MKKLDHPNVVKLVEVLDDPEDDQLYMGEQSAQQMDELLAQYKVSDQLSIWVSDQLSLWVSDKLYLVRDIMYICSIWGKGKFYTSNQLYFGE